MVQLLCGLHCNMSIRTVRISGTHEDNGRNTDEFVQKERKSWKKAMSESLRLYELMTFERLDPN
jgi:hypothetical protein